MATQNKSRVPVGTIVGSKFRITKEIGRGGMAAVYEAENIDIGKRVAVKILAAELITSKVVRERFLREARAAAAIRSPYICDVYDSGVYEERPFLVMELLEGESLYDRLTRVRRLDPDTTLTISTHSARGLAQAHDANVVHRDLKPENIFVTTTPEGHMLGKILDFGLAKFYEPTDGTGENVRLTREGALFGTPAYMSPEQAKGQGAVDHRADLWALGCIVYECLTGQTVWNVDQGVAMILAQIAGAPIPRPSRLRPDLPKTFDPWFLKALDRDPNRRFQTAKEFADSLADALRPLPEVERAHSLHSEAEGVVLDQLISDPAASSLGAMAASPPVQPHIPTPAAEIPTWRPGSRSSGRAIAVLLLFAALGLGAYAVWLYVLHPPGTQTAASGSGLSTSGSPAASAGSAKLEPREGEAYALQIAAAQQALRDGKVKDAVSLFKEAFNNGGSNVARALASHSTVALETSEGKCKVTGLGRPRPFSLVIDSSRPTIAATSAGLVATWVDNHEDSRKKQGFSALLDGALRRVNEPLLVTPEASSVRHPQLAQLNDKLALLYWEDANNEPGVYVRRLDAEGRIAGPARRVSATKREQFYPALAAAGEAGFWAVWSEERETGVEDLVGRRLGKEFEPIGPPVRLTRHVTTPGVKVAASKPDVAVAHGTLFVVFALETATETRPMLLRVKLDDPELSSASRDPNADKKRKRSKGDWTVGTTKPIVPTAKGKNAQPRIACSTEGCFAAWDDENAGANLAFIDKDRGEAIWHREISKRGARPAVAVSGSAAAVAWYEASRVKIALISRDKLGEPSVLARVSGHQPYPAIAPGLEPGQWYISWRDYEAGHLEAFVVRAGCQ